VKPGKIGRGDLFGLPAPQLGEHDLFQKAPVVRGRGRFALRLDMLGKKNLG
jgi:hypothetical protein